ncbi:MAG: hypothetical protein GH156_00550 [Dehalococcoidia bacterium]|nr:hypothetical protein [Dehalococcoidia bacterium]
MREYTVTLSDEEEKALLTDMVSIQEWLDNVIHNKARQCIDMIVEQHSDRQPKKLPVEEKLRVVREAKVESAAERQAKFEAEMRERE